MRVGGRIGSTCEGEISIGRREGRGVRARRMRGGRKKAGRRERERDPSHWVHTDRLALSPNENPSEGAQHAIRLLPLLPGPQHLPVESARGKRAQQ